VALLSLCAALRECAVAGVFSLFAHRVDAPFTATRRCNIQEQKAVQDSIFATIGNRVKAAWCVRDKIGEC
jgi:hypothetical protein